MKQNNSTLMYILVIASLALISCSSTSIITSDGYDLNYSIEKGSEITITGSSKSTFDQGQFGYTNLNSRSEFMFTITDKKKDNVSVELVFGETSLDLESPNGNASTDFSELVGKKANFDLSSKGKLSGFSGFDKLPEIMTASQESLNEEKYKISIEGLFSVLPDEPVKIGGTWTEEKTVDIPSDGGLFTTVNKTTYTLLEEVQREGYDCLVIEAISTSDLTGSLVQQGTELSVVRSTRGKSTIYFAYKIGMNIEISNTSEGEGTITVLLNGMEIPQAITSSSTVKFSIK